MRARQIDSQQDLSKMASKMKLSRLESEIEKYRNEGDWSKISELVKQFSTKNPSQGKGYRNGFLSPNIIINVE